MHLVCTGLSAALRPGGALPAGLLTGTQLHANLEILCTACCRWCPALQVLWAQRPCRCQPFYHRRGSILMLFD